MKRGTGRERTEVESQTVDAEERLTLNQTTFQQILEAAYVLQQHHQAQFAPQSEADSTETLPEIVEIQERLRSRKYDLPTAANLIAQGLAKVTDASGVAIAVVHQDQLEYCAALGTLSILLGSRVPASQISSADSLPRHTKSSLTVPIQNDGEVAGLLEVCLENSDSLGEQQFRSCQFMAGLMTEVIITTADQEWQHLLAAERSSMLEALEKIKPQLERLVVDPESRTTEPDAQPGEHGLDSPFNSVPGKSAHHPICPRCAYQFGDDELFCGRCGTARPDEPPTHDLQSDWAAMLKAEHAAEQSDDKDLEPEMLARLVNELPPHGFKQAKPEQVDLGLHGGNLKASRQESDDTSAKTVVNRPAATPESASLAVADKKSSSSVPWTSAAKTQEWLESLRADSPARRWLTKNRGNIYLGAALVVLLVVLSGLGTKSMQSAAPGKNAQPDLTLLEKLMVSLGLAEVPPPPAYMGNPNAQVWVDLHTALYYCAGSDLYGKTPGGKFTSQRDAQLDQFEPASRKSCN